MTFTSQDYKSGFFWLLGFLLTVSLTMGGWSLGKTVELDSRTVELGTRLGGVEESRFTDSDALQMEIQFRAELSASVTEIKKCLNQIQRQQPCEI